MGKMNDFELIEDTERIIRSGVREVFVPSQPVSQNFFCGRKTEAGRIVNDVCMPGMHVLLYGDRGVGKTSLANFACNLIINRGLKNKAVLIRCDKNDTFNSIAQRIFEELEIRITIKSSTTKGASVSVMSATGGKKREVETSVYYDFDSPSWVAKNICDINCVIIIDEFDVISDKNEKQKISTLLKNLSDRGSKVSILIVGIAFSAVELLEGHPSISRCISEIKLNRMTEEELLDIIEKGEERLGITFDKDVKKKVVQSSSGFPYFTHLLSLKSSEVAILEERETISLDMYNRALGNAIMAIEASLYEKYNNVVLEIEKRKTILYCAALIGDKDFTSKQLQQKYKEITGVSIQQIEINNSISKAMSEGPETILRRKKKGVYFFNDPRMPVYIKLIQANS